MKIYRVGGCIRDGFIGRTSKDEDRAVELPTHLSAEDAFDEMRQYLLEEDYTIFEERPQHLTIRAHYPKDHPLRGRQTADFAVCRKDGEYLDGRRPESVSVGTIHDDLARRDFTMNAIAVYESDDRFNGVILDPFDGIGDIERRRIRFVGEPMDRLREDGLRLLRALRFMVTLNFNFVFDSFHDPEVAELLHGVSNERIVDELHKMFLHDTEASLLVITSLPSALQSAIFRNNTVKLLPTLGRKVAQ